MGKRSLTILIIISLALLVAGFFSIRYLQQRLEEREAGAVIKQKTDISITIVEGKRREEIAALLQEMGICSAESFLAATVNEEGTLFPDTYRFFPDTSVDDVVTTLQANYTKRTAGLTLSPEDITLASIVEREAQNDAERATIAGVYQNRLDIGMKLDADPTVQYAKDTLEYVAAGQPLTFSFWDPILRADYQGVVSPYNTYRTPGLPPGPIANPGLQSLKAALAPEDHSYFYFFHRNGEIILSKTLAEQEAKLRSIP